MVKNTTSNGVREEILAKIETLEDEVIRLNEAACRKDLERGGLTPYEFVNLPEVRAKDEALARLDNFCEILEKFYPPTLPPQSEWGKELLY